MSIANLSPRDRGHITVEKHYRELEGETLSKVQGRLRAKNIHIDKSDLEEAYCLAWNAVVEMISDGQKIDSLQAVLITITWRRAIDEYREIHKDRRVELDIDRQPAEGDLDQDLANRIKLKGFFERLKRRLNEQEKIAVSLCVIHGYSRPEAANLLGISERRVQKIMDSATKKMGVIVASINARGCGDDDEWSDLLRRFALNLVADTEPDHARVVEHMSGCDHCTRYVRNLQGLAGITPPIGFHFLPGGGHEGAILAHLEKMFTSGHSAIQTGATAGAAGGGGSLIGSVGGASVVKGVAALAVVTAAGVSAVVAKPLTHRTPRQPVAVYRESAVAQPQQALLIAPTLSRLSRHVPKHGRPAHGHSARHITRNQQPLAEFGFEKQPTPAPVVHPPAAPPPPSKESADTRREFGFEK